MFLIEGLPASALALLILKAMPDSPSAAVWLSREEKNVVALRLAAESVDQAQDFWLALRDPRVLALSATALCMQSGLFGISFWLPQIVQSMGLSNLATGFAVVPPYIASAAAMILWGRSSDRANERIWHLALAAFLGAGGLIAASLSRSNGLVFFELTVAMIGIHSTFGPFWGIPTFLGDKAAAGGIAFINSIGSLGGFLAPSYIGLIKQSTGGYAASMALLAAELLAAGLIALALGRSLHQRRLTESLDLRFKGQTPGSL